MTRQKILRDRGWRQHLGWWYYPRDATGRIYPGQEIFGIAAVWEAEQKRKAIVKVYEEVEVDEQP